MRHVDAWRATAPTRALARALAAAVTRPWTVMEVCGGQTHAFVRFGLDRLLPEGLELVHGPGCPVCVTPVHVLDEALALGRRDDVVLCTFGDMLRVPGSRGDLQRARAEGADVRVVASPLDVLRVARDVAPRVAVFLAVGFETTAPAVAATVLRAAAEGVDNLAVLVAHVRVPPAIEAIVAGEGARVQGFLAAGHVCAVEGVAPYRPLAARLRVPIVVTGFEPVDLLRGLLACVRQLEAGRAEAENAYERVVREEGSPLARAAVDEVFEVVDQRWRGLGVLPGSGLGLRSAYRRFDARVRFPDLGAGGVEDERCHAGAVLQGRIRPFACPSFGSACTPETPLGAPMVSSEGACAAWYRFRGAP